MKINLEKSIKINGTETKELDINLDNLTAWDMSDCKRIWQARGNNQAPCMALDYEYGLIVAARALNIPFEDIMQVSARDYALIGQSMVNFLLGAD